MIASIGSVLTNQFTVALLLLIFGVVSLVRSTGEAERMVSGIELVEERVSRQRQALMAIRGMAILALAVSALSFVRGII
jgi:hypothetical protein